MRDSITQVLKVALVALTVTTGVASLLLFVQTASTEDPSLPDSDGDGFLDVDEWGWRTSILDRNDSPLTTRILPVAIGAAALAVIYSLGRMRRWKRPASLAPVLLGKLDIFKAAVRARNRSDINACKSDFDRTISGMRMGSHRDSLNEPYIQDILVEFEVLCIDAFVDEQGSP